MNTTAYCVLHLDTSVHPPVVKGAGIYSEPAALLTFAIGSTVFAVDVLKVTNPAGYAAAQSELLLYVARDPAHRWLARYLADR